MNIFNKALWLNALEHALVAACAVLAGSQVFTQGSITLKSLEATGIAAGTAALYAFVKQLGGVQAVAAVLKVKVTAKHVAP